jgi:hypothetical protein
MAGHLAEAGPAQRRENRAKSAENLTPASLANGYVSPKNDVQTDT